MKKTQFYYLDQDRLTNLQVLYIISISIKRVMSGSPFKGHPDLAVLTKEHLVVASRLRQQKVLLEQR